MYCLNCLSASCMAHRSANGPYTSVHHDLLLLTVISECTHNHLYFDDSDAPMTFIDDSDDFSR